MELTAEQKALNEKALRAHWFGGCRLCPFTMWHGDTEDYVRGLVEKHVAEHHVLIDVWQNPAWGS